MVCESSGMTSGGVFAGISTDGLGGCESVSDDSDGVCGESFGTITGVGSAFGRCSDVSGETDGVFGEWSVFPAAFEFAGVRVRICLVPRSS